ncbi:MAG: hypothetical protein Q9228_005187 [Teloschistes exilis]
MSLTHVARAAASTEANNGCTVPATYNNAIDLSLGITLHDFMIIVSGACSIASWLIMIPLGVSHLRNWTCPHEQRLMLRVIFVIPLIATFNVFIVWFYDASWYLRPFPDIMEAFGVVSLFVLFVTYVTPDQSSREQFYDSIEQQDRHGKKVPGKEGQGSLEWFHNIWILVFQILVGRVATTIASEVLTATECSTSRKLNHRRTIVNVTASIETVITLLAILRYYGRLKSHLQPRGSMWKLMTYKGIIFFSIFPDTIIQALVSYSALKPSTYISYYDWQLGIPALITCVLMFLFSPLFWLTFPALRYREAAEQGQRRESFATALVQVVNISDLFVGIWLMIQMWRPSNYGKRYTSGIRKELDSASSNSSTTTPLPTHQQQLVSTDGVTAVSNPETWLQAQSTAWGGPLTIDGDCNLDSPKEDYYTNFAANKLNVGRIRSAFSFLRPALAAAHDDSHLPCLFAHSFAKAFFGQYYRMPSVIADAQAEYGKQLLVLKENLSMAGSTDYVSLFHGIMAAVMYEFVTVTMPDGWSWHISALAEIVESHGRVAYRQFHAVVGFAMCRMCRALIIGNATQSRKRTFLERPEWTISEPELLPKALQDEFTDVHAQLPGLLEDYDTLVASGSTVSGDAPAHGNLYLRVLALANTLFAWRWAWERQHAYEVWLVPSTNSRYVPRDADSGEPLYPTLIYFSDYFRWNEMQRYNSVLLVVLDLARAIHGDEGFLSDLDRSIPPDLLSVTHRSPLCLPSDPDLCLHTVAAEHVRSLEFSLRDASQVSLTGLFSLLNLNLTYKTLTPDHPLSGWIRDICGQIATLSGFHVGSKFKPSRTMNKELQWSRFYLAEEA